MVGAKLQGEKQLARRLHRLPERVEKRVQKKMLRAGAGAVVKAARTRVSRRHGHLRKSLGIKVARRTDPAMVLIGARTKYKVVVDGQKVQPANYLHLVELGTAPHDIETTWRSRAPRTIRHPGARAQPFLRPALNASRSEVLKAYEQAGRKAIAKEAAKIK